MKEDDSQERSICLLEGKSGINSESRESGSEESKETRHLQRGTLISMGSGSKLAVAIHLGVEDFTVS